MQVDLDGLFLDNDTYDYKDYEDPDSVAGSSEAVLFPVLYGVGLVVGLVGNGLLMTVLAQKRRSWSISDTFILHLSIADILLLVTLPFWAAQAAHRHGWCVGDSWCKISGAAFNINFYCGIFLLVCISVDRYMSIVRGAGLFSQKRPSLPHISCLLVWCGSLILAIPEFIFTAQRKDSTGERSVCDHNRGQFVSRLLHHSLGFLLPAAILVVCFSIILRRLQRDAKGLQKLRAIAVILPLTAVFLVCWVPYNITLIVDTFTSSSAKPGNDLSGGPEGSLKTALTVTSALGCAHACLRPLLYLCLCGNLRRRIKCDSTECEGSVWELGVGRETAHDPSPEPEEQKQMTSLDQQVQSSPC